MTATSPPLAPPLVEKKQFRFGPHTTWLGERIEEVRFGWESHGTLNAACDNAILIFHFLTGTSHCAGRYAASDRRPGYWDGLIGPGKAIDTDRYFVLSADALCNANALRADVITTGPASVDPATGRPYGPGFPVIAFQDMVDVQVKLLDSLGIRRLHAAMGLSMGGCLSLELASSHPDRVARIIPIACGAAADAWLSAWIDVWTSQIKLDPNWRGGHYYDGEPPRAGMTAGLKMVTLHGRHWTYTNGDEDSTTFGRAWEDPARNPALDIDARYYVEADMEEGAAARSRFMDANHFLYLARALRSYRVGRTGSVAEALARIEAKVLLLHSATEDHMFNVSNVRKLIAGLMENGVRLQVIENSQTLGHSDLGMVESPETGSVLASFLETD